ncbi:MAG: helix-turn-helix transcriptional regulator [Bacteroidales bacterium]|nr:helix-turn-helix transcriptional regulator [Bacteroidales bacterium]MDD4829971.1 helix-turn-helix transcriptional regulator [Bacteroidales bacterium]
MESFDIIKPCSLLEPFIKYYWILDYESRVVEPIRVIPYGCVQFTFYLGERINSLGSNNDSSYKDQAVVTGQISSFFDVVPQGKIRLITIVFKPFGAKPFFDFPIFEIQNNIIPIKDINNKEWLDLENRLGDCVDNKSIVSCLENNLLKKLEKNTLFNSYSSINNERIMLAINRIDDSKGTINIKDLSSLACLSDKQFNRIFADYVGMNPKNFLRIIRYQSFLLKLQNSNIKATKAVDFLDLVYDCGYYDQSHLINNFKEFTGYTPKEYIKLFSPCSEYFSM